MNSWLRLGFAALALWLGAACGTTRTERTAQPAARAGDLQSPSLRVADAPDGGCKPPARALQKWNPIWWFGNVDDPEPPEWYRPGAPGRRWLWQLRNPLHNFTFYVLGVADKPFTRTGKFPAAVFAPDGGWNWAVARFGWLRLPFVSFNGEWGRFYFGWRERGNFGCKVNCGRTKPPDARPQTPTVPP